MADETTTTTSETAEGGENIQDLRDAARRGKEADTRAAAAERRLAFAEAGIPTGVPEDDERYSMVQTFMRGYEGELTADAIRNDPMAEFILQGTAPSGGPTPAEEQVAAMRSDFAGGSVTPSEADRPTEDPREGAWNEYQESLGRGESMRMAQMNYVAHLVANYAHPDAQFDPAAWEAAAKAYDAAT